MPPTTDPIETMTLLASDPPQILLCALSASSFDFFHKIYEDFGLKILYTKILGVEEHSNIAYRKYPGHQVLFPYFQRIQPSFGYLLLFSLFLVSFALTGIKICSCSFFENLFRLFSSIFSPIKPKIIRKWQLYSMIVIGVWLISTFLISVTFRNHILEDMVIVIPNRVIDSWNDLKNRPEVMIRATDSDLIVEYAKKSKDQMAITFWDRLKAYPLEAFFNQSFVEQIMSELSSGESALVGGRLSLIYTLKYMHFSINESDPFFLKRLHVSKTGGEHVPYFAFIIESAGSFLLPGWNHMYKLF